MRSQKNAAAASRSNLTIGTKRVRNAAAGGVRCLVAGLVCLAGAAQPAPAQTQVAQTQVAQTQAADVTIGTGSTSGVYFQVGRSICRLMKATAADHNLTCESRPSGGSIANLQALREGAITLGVVQSDWQFHAMQGTSVFAGTGHDPDLRALFSVHGEPFTVVARRDSGIGAFADLPGHRVNIGNPGSGQRATMEVVMRAMGWTRDSFLLAEELPASEQSLALCHDRIQAMVYTVGHPNPSVGQAISLCGAWIVPVEGGPIDGLVEGNPYYAYTNIPGGLYDGMDQPVRTFGVKATVVSSAKVDAETIYQVVRAVFGNLDDLRRMHPAFGALEARRMAVDGLSAPLHDGARRYFEEAGLIEP